ncbi:ATP-binding cassette domain-containing protein [Glutamicibacter sp.]|uniref:ATP-binding cassette domain-containing protein n=1 Tax=Glutamicibacter sp. TaxID=1931995 RepID=UPI0028BE731E|nr:ATP-binding cassette domain-containing protein [Glutamicibacter sp.]
MSLVSIRPVIVLRNACVDAVGNRRLLLEIDSLELFPGERIVITGPSGSGKSLLLATMTGRWANGLRFQGERGANFSRIGVVPQRGLDAFHPLVPLDKQLRRVSCRSNIEVQDALVSVGLNDPLLWRRRPAELSGGQVQRAAIALATLTRAPLILADEPTSALDHASREQTTKLLKHVITDEQTLVVVTHDPRVANLLATRHLRIEAGRISQIPLESHEQKI